MNVGLFVPSLSSSHIHQSFSNLLLVLPCLLKIPKWFYIFFYEAWGWRYQFAAMFSNGFGNIFHKNKLIVFKYIRATLANNYFANQESLPLPRHFQTIDINSLPLGPLLCGHRREIRIPPPTSEVEEWLDIKQKRLINLSAVSHHHQTLNEIVFGWWKFQSAKRFRSPGCGGSRECWVRLLDSMELPSGHWLWFRKYFPCDLSLAVPDGHASWQPSLNISTDFHRSPFVEH